MTTSLFIPYMKDIYYYDQLIEVNNLILVVFKLNKDRLLDEVRHHRLATKLIITTRHRTPL